MGSIDGVMEGEVRPECVVAVIVNRSEACLARNLLLGWGAWGRRWRYLRGEKSVIKKCAEGLSPSSRSQDDL